jgi:hypothetical protein
MTPVSAHQYSNRKKIDIIHGPGYVQGKREKSFDGFGFHSSLQRTFKGPKDYRDYLKANNLHEAGLGDRPKEEEYKAPRWDEDLIRLAIREGVEIGSVLAEALLNGELDFPEDA